MHANCNTTLDSSLVVSARSHELLFLLRSDVIVNQPYERVRERMTDRPHAWLPAAAESANGVGRRLLSELGFGLAKRRLAKRIEVTLGEPTAAEDMTLIPIGWRAASAAAFFPTLDGQLEIAKVAADSTRLAISAGYDPPLGLAGQVLDRAVLHRIAEATVREFIQRIAERLEGTHPDQNIGNKSD